MKIFGRDFFVAKAAVAPISNIPGISHNSWLGGFFNSVLESFPGAWQRNVELAPMRDITAFSAVYSCISTIANDIAKLRFMLVEQKPDGTWPEVTRFNSGAKGTAFLPVLRKPNRYQTRIQFLVQWLVMKLLYGNTYVLKQYDNRGVVIAMYVLDSRLVVPRVASDGQVFYTLKRDPLANLEDELTVPAEAIIHDTGITLWHPLCGVSPIYACGMSATQGLKIQQNSGVFFGNMSRPSGMLTAPGEISDTTANRLKQEWEKNFSNGNIGRMAVLGDGLKYEAMTIPAADAQLIEQLRWTVEDVARCFHVPLHMIGAGSAQPVANVGAANQAYYSQTLQILIENIELLIDEGLGLPALNYGCELDLEPLLRMDPMSRADTATKFVGAGVWSPNEARLRENLAPVKGGETPYLQQQNFSLAALAERDANDPFAKPPPPAPPPPPVAPPSNEDDDEPANDEVAGEEEARMFVEKLIEKFAA